jgi:hypothetical protein
LEKPVAQNGLRKAVESLNRGNRDRPCEQSGDFSINHPALKQPGNQREHEMARYHRIIGRDPYWLSAKYDGQCDAPGCNHAIRRGDRAFYYPNTRTILAAECGHADAAAREFDAARADEDNYRYTGAAMTDRYIARVYDRAGRPRYKSAAHDTREQAAADAFGAMPKARDCSTSRASLVDGRWQDFGFDIRSHNRRNR